MSTGKNRQEAIAALATEYGVDVSEVEAVLSIPGAPGLHARTVSAVERALDERDAADGSLRKLVEEWVAATEDLTAATRAEIALCRQYSLAGVDPYPEDDEQAAALPTDLRAATLAQIAAKKRETDATATLRAAVVLTPTDGETDR